MRYPSVGSLRFRSHVQPPWPEVRETGTHRSGPSSLALKCAAPSGRQASSLPEVFSWRCLGLRTENARPPLRRARQTTGSCSCEPKVRAARAVGSRGLIAVGSPAPHSGFKPHTTGTAPRAQGCSPRERIVAASLPSLLPSSASDFVLCPRVLRAIVDSLPVGYSAEVGPPNGTAPPTCPHCQEVPHMA